MNKKKNLKKFNKLNKLIRVDVFLCILIVFDVFTFLFYKINTTKPYFTENDIKVVGRNIGIKNSFVNVDGNKYYIDSNEDIVKDMVLSVGDKLYYFDNEGKLVTNQNNFEINNVIYSINEDGVLSKKNE